MKVKFLKYIFLFLLVFLFGVQTTYAKTELVFPTKSSSFLIEQSQSFKSLEKEVQPNIGFLKEKTRFVVFEGISDIVFTNAKYIDNGVEQTGTLSIVKNGDEVGVKLGNGGTRFIAKSGDELETFLNEITDLPTGVSYSGKLYRYKPTGATYSVMDINPNMNPLENRFKTGLYASTSKNGNLIEVNAYGGTAGKTQYEISNVQLNNVLDLTDEATIKQLGTSFEQMKLSGVSNKYEYTHEVADWAKSNGYSGMKFNGAQGSGTVYENIIIFEQSTINSSITNSSIDPVSW